MKVVFAIANGVTITTSMVCMSYLYQRRWRQAAPRVLVGSAIIIGLTLVITTLQYLVPAVLPLFRRDLSALVAGEWWRLVSPLFVQPLGWGQCLFNGLFLFVFVPIAERLYGGGIWPIYFVSGMVGQLANYSWLPDGGGSSTAAFGTMGSLLVWVLWQRSSTPLQYVIFASLGLCRALGLSLVHDGHGPGMLAGAMIAMVLCGRRKGFF